MLYPEQNEARLKLSLDGTWAFALGSCVEDQFDPAKPLPDAQPIAVPASYNDQNDQTTALRRHYGWVWYQRKVTLPAFCAGQRVVLRFGSVTHTAKVWLNGQLIAQHKGGFTPFEADVTALLQPGETALLTVACDNRVNHSTLPVG
uniref:sugar-binding domain-containing protein n=1 Tax=Faecalibacterium sp. TaxID=1971605 RepID=UPI003FEEF4CB